MKKLALLLWTMLAMTSMVIGQSRFTSLFGGKYNEHAMAVTQTDDGGYVSAGFTYSFGKGESDVWVTKVDAYGQEIWRRYLGGEGFDWVSDMVMTRDGNFTLVGHKRPKDSTHVDGWVCQLNRYGEIMWERTLGGQKADQLRSLIQTQDGGFAAAGFTYSQGQGKSDFWLVRFDAVGNTLWENAYGSSRDDKGYDLIETTAGELILGGYVFYPEPFETCMFVMKVDRKGKGIWRKAIQSRGHATIEKLTLAADGGYLAVGWGQSKEGKRLEGRIVKMTSGGRVEWEKDFGDGGKDAFYDVKSSGGDSFVIFGQKEQPGSKQDLWLLKIDARGEVIWEQVAKGDKKDWGHAFNFTQDGGFILAGATKSYGEGGTDMYIAKTDRRGNLEPGYFAEDASFIAQKDPDRPQDEPEDPFKPNLYILSIGISDYQHEPIDLTFAHKDAQSIAQQFEETEGNLFGKVYSRQLLNEEASLLNIKKGLTWLEREATQKDVILLFVSAHGALDNKGNLYILPTDFISNDLFATGLNISSLTEGINGTPCKKLILLDACHSGQSAYDMLSLASIKALNVNQAVESLLGQESGVTVMTSSSGKEFSYENPRWGHGAFTKAILEGLRGRADYNHDQLVSLLELNLYVTQRVKELTGGQQHPYTPINLFGDIPLFVLE